ncbi:hypothetical protein F5B20DRAFT_440429 [Whalleya microplaca]|nr:hypothetical protein F5B20DRAFT_440429 [Whalleya microplaca]
MYIPQTNHHNPDSLLASAKRVTEGQQWLLEFLCPKYAFSANSAVPSVHQFFVRSFHVFTTTSHYAQSLQKRAAGDNMNATIGAVVGVLLALFLAAAFAFLYVYRKSIRFTRRKKRRHRKSAVSKGSKGSDGGGPPPPG